MDGSSVPELQGGAAVYLHTTYTPFLEAHQAHCSLIYFWSTSRTPHSTLPMLVHDLNNVAALSIVFTVGSKAEVTGMTGSAHILEHELFKKFPGFDIWHDLGDYGARINASTSKNRTEFHEILPAGRVASALQL